MSTQLNKKYGLFTAICTVVGTVIGSGVFFKAEAILKKTGGELPVGILAWIIGGIIMVICAYAFSVLAAKHEKVSGVVDYAEALVGKKYAYFMGWFLAIFYYPTLTSVLAWLSARYLCVLLGWGETGGECMTIAALLLVGVFVMNALAPKIAGKFQVSATIIKLIPLLLMAVVGTITGLTNGLLIENFKEIPLVPGVTTGESVPGGLFAAVVATAFAYEGWICATAINAELKDAKKNLPKALVIGTLIIVAVYITYYIGFSGSISTGELLSVPANEGAKIAFTSVFKSLAGTVLFVFVIISCMGTLNGLTLGCSRAIYSISSRNMGPRPDVFKQVDSSTNMPVNSALFGLLISAFWLVYFYGSNLVAKPWFGNFSFDSSELPIITTYAMYIPIFVAMLIKGKDYGAVKGRIAPILGIVGSIVMVVAAVIAHGINPYKAGQAADEPYFSFPILFYLIVYAAIMIAGVFFMKSKKAKK